MLTFTCDLCGKQVILRSGFIEDIKNGIIYDMEHKDGVVLGHNHVFDTFDVGGIGADYDYANVCVGRCAGEYLEIIRTSKNELKNELKEIINQKVKIAKMDNSRYLDEGQYVE